MALSDIKQRTFKPNWRSPQKTILNGELDVVVNNPQKEVPASIDSYIEDWDKNHSLIYAGELLGAAVTNNCEIKGPVAEAADFILSSNQLGIGDPLYDLANTLIGDNSNINQGGDRENMIPSLSDYSNKIREKVHLKRELVRQAPYNAIRRMELARFYILNGQREKACEEAAISVHLAPNNRYISRSAVRCFIHNHDYERAHWVLSANRTLKTDPWLLATDISVDLIRKKNPRNALTAGRVVKNNNFSPRSLTETSIALALLEYYNGGRLKTIRDYVRKALVAPIDNSMAQAQWLSKIYPGINLSELDTSHIKFNYEIETYKAINNSEFSHAYLNALQWLQDSGYSHRAAVTASNLAATFLNKTENSIAILDIALLANPGSPILLNNLVYQLLMNGELERAEKEISKVDYGLDIPQETLTCLKATNGLLNFKKGNYELGETCYLEAIEMAHRNHDIRYEDVARLNLYREKAMAHIITKQEALEYISKIKASDISVSQQIINAIDILS